MRKLNDFGDKIGGAKKDLWAFFNSLSDEEQGNMARKIKLWRRPNYQTMLKEGTPKEVFRNVKMLKEIGLDVPYMTELATSLREEGIEINDDILTVDEMVVKLCQLL